jgi:hypothetical protein
MIRPLWVLVLALVLPLPAFAQPAAEPDPAELAIAKGREGVTLYEAGEWARALALFEEAEGLYHSPVLVLYAARSHTHLGHLVAAKKLYRSLADERIAPGSPSSWQKAQIDGAAELKAIDADIPRLTVEIAGGTSAARATVDDVAVALGTPIEVDPGPHRVDIVDGATRRSRKITLRRGESSRASFDLAPPVEPTVDEGIGPWRVFGIVLTTVGGASLVAGGVVGGLALAESSSAKDDLPETCTPDRSCLASDEAAIEASFDTAYTMASAADGLLIGGGIAAAAGILVLILDPDASAPPSSAGGVTIRF